MINIFVYLGKVENLVLVVDSENLSGFLKMYGNKRFFVIGGWIVV